MSYRTSLPLHPTEDDSPKVEKKRTTRSGKTITKSRSSKWTEKESGDVVKETKRSRETTKGGKTIKSGSKTKKQTFQAPVGYGKKIKEKDVKRVRTPKSDKITKTKSKDVVRRGYSPTKRVKAKRKTQGRRILKDVSSSRYKSPGR